MSTQQTDEAFDAWLDKHIVALGKCNKSRAMQLAFIAGASHGLELCKQTIAEVLEPAEVKE